ncbi:4a-hydroxytetrahydrobiopterin dehydratase [Methanoplanus sp. FWC-SCC4]|uniref:4a-hydroxytetrahydrobiopterin dehydratase n=2 Tax=Methanochimaera problematica TaxID=2609417 RepID=A0AA97FAW8_9EURY|nr:4a-hydroxytetrahydrobiopterin dehydratase [Methanoplanus sp. FWC-SCC4]
MDMHNERCDPDVGRTAPLTRKEVLSLVPKVTGWEIRESKLRRLYRGENFEDCVIFLDDLTDLCNTQCHYPDISISKGRLIEVSWYTYASGGLTRNDFIMASKMNSSEKFNI